MTRERFVRAGPVPLTGRAWSGRAPVARVEVSTDGGRHLGRRRPRPADPAHPFAWRPWSLRVGRARPGEFELLARATDGTAALSRSSRTGTVQGMANNLVQRVPVTVLP